MTFSALAKRRLMARILELVGGWCMGTFFPEGPHHLSRQCLVTVVGKADWYCSTCEVLFWVEVRAWQGGLEFH